MSISRLSQQDYSALISLWEASVKATHDFLPAEKIAELKPLILAHYFDAVALFGFRSTDGKILGFSGVADGAIEMLFVTPESFGQGIGKALCLHAINNLQATKVDVNEQNPDAIGFYRHLGFEVVGRSAIDGEGNPFPLLHLALVRS